MRKDLGQFHLKVAPWSGVEASDPTRADFKILAVDSSTEENVGFACVCHAGRKIYIHEVFVEERLRRRGLASAMYDWAEQITNKEVVPSSDFSEETIEGKLSGEGVAFWEARWRK